MNRQTLCIPRLPSPPPLVVLLGSLLLQLGLLAYTIHYGAYSKFLNLPSVHPLPSSFLVQRERSRRTYTYKHTYMHIYIHYIL
ncbi:hypothetical protein F5X96DRAFT_369575 [Biscogniauxia mediterranea]|nr:hypothetical protein F5X96DRAFT_369575 [Biscogniauxia mediterranea]